MVRSVWATQGKVQVLSRRQERMARELKGVFLSAPMDWRWHLLNREWSAPWGGAVQTCSVVRSQPESQAAARSPTFLAAKAEKHSQLLVTLLKGAIKIIKL